MLTVATLNFENLFTRPLAMNEERVPDGAQAITDHATANALAAKERYGVRDKARLAELAERYGWHLARPPAALVRLRRLRGRLFGRDEAGGAVVVAEGRASWTGWFELTREDLSWAATYNTARVIAAVAPDVLVTVEVEDRPTLLRFRDQVLGPSFGLSYPHVMVIDGNDQRGIDVGLMSRVPIEAVRSHVDDQRHGRPIFCRDCPEYDLLLPGGERLVVIPCHFKSKLNGDSAESSARRAAEARRAHAIARAAEARSPYVLLAGDLNDTPDSGPLAPLFAHSYRDVSRHRDYPRERPGTFGSGRANEKLDYLIPSKALGSRLVTTGVERRGTYRPRLWEPFDTVTSVADSASDHHLLWATFDL